MKVRIEQDLHGAGRVTIKDLKEFVEAVEAAAGNSIQTEYEYVEIRTYSLVYEREN